MGIESPGGGRIRLESVAGFAWNRWPDSPGIGGRIPVKSVAGFAWTMQRTMRTQSRSVEFAPAKGGASAHLGTSAKQLDWIGFGEQILPNGSSQGQPRCA